MSEQYYKLLITESKRQLGRSRHLILAERYLTPSHSTIQAIIDKIYEYAKEFKSKDIQGALDRCKQDLIDYLDRSSSQSLISRKAYLISSLNNYTSQRLPLCKDIFPLRQFSEEFVYYLNTKLHKDHLRLLIDTTIGDDIIRGGSYNTETTSIALNISRVGLLYLYLRLDKDIFIDDFAPYYIREHTHLQQDQLNFNKQPIKRFTTTDNQGNSLSLEDIESSAIQYFSQQSEIDAYARFVGRLLASVVYELEGEVSYRELSKLLSQGNIRDLLLRGKQLGIIDSEARTAYDIYKTMPSKVFNKFLRRVADYFEDQSKGKYDYKDWFLTKEPLDPVQESLKRIVQLAKM